LTPVRWRFIPSIRDAGTIISGKCNPRGLTSTRRNGTANSTCASADLHLHGGFFDADRTLALIEDIRERSRQQGFGRIRFVTQMEWALEDRPGVGSLLEYEASANLVPFEDVVVCVYDLARFSGSVVVDVMRTHPMVIIGGILQENPYYVPPREYLRELRERRHAGQTS